MFAEKAAQSHLPVSPPVTSPSLPSICTNRHAFEELLVIPTETLR